MLLLGRQTGNFLEALRVPWAPATVTVERGRHTTPLPGASVAHMALGLSGSDILHSMGAILY